MQSANRQTRPHILALGQAIRSDWPIYLIAGIYVLAGSLYLASIGQSGFGTLNAYIRAWAMNFGVLAPYLVTLFGIVRITLRIRQRKNLAYRAMLAPHRTARFIAGTILLLTAILLFTSMFSSIKATFPLAHGFLFDHAQADIDKAIHFGVDPWRLLFAFAKHPLVLRLVELNYNVFWFIVCYGALYWVLTSPRAERIRVRYMLTWLTVWIVIGTVMASIWLSAGPAFYGLVTGDTARFGEQMAFLATSAGDYSSAHNFQAYLWALHELGKPGFGSGISAFPSMHVALITLNALFVGETSRRWAMLMWAYVAFVAMSSVYLGWHYAIDGYVSIVVVTLVYHLFKRALPVLSRLRLNGLQPADFGTAATR